MIESQYFKCILSVCTFSFVVDLHFFVELRFGLR